MTTSGWKMSLIVVKMMQHYEHVLVTVNPEDVILQRHASYYMKTCQVNK